MSKILIITASLRAGSNSDALAGKILEGALSAGREAEVLSLKGKELGFCIGCLACQKTGRCVKNDDAAGIMEKVREADTLVFVTPIYYYEMSGQMKTLLDRLNPLYGREYRFRNIYLATVAADDDEHTPDRALSGLGGWVACFPEAELKGSVFFGGIDGMGQAAKDADALGRAFEFGRGLE